MCSPPLIAAESILRGEPQPGSSDHLEVRLRAALLTREVIALAQGVLMERNGLSANAAYADLRRFSARTSMPLHVRAEQVLASTSTSARPEVA